VSSSRDVILSGGGASPPESKDLWLEPVAPAAGFVLRQPKR
jgi:hypothetical protein